MSHNDDGIDGHLSSERSRADSRPEIPTIITSDLSSTTSLVPRLSFDDGGTTGSDALAHQSSSYYDNTARSPSDHGLLSPTSILRPGRTSLDVPPSSPTGSAWGSDAGTHVPASPTSSIHSVPSVHFASTLALRNNNPDEGQGLSSLGLLSPSHGGATHKRKPSNASTIGSDTDPDSHSLGMNTLAPTVSPTYSHFDTSSVGGTTVHDRSPSRSTFRQGKDASGPEGASGDNEGPPERPAAPDPTLDENIDAKPFMFKPYQLASLVDPKSLEALTAMGGTTGLLEGLGTHGKRGLEDDSHHANTTPGDGRPGAGSPGAGEGASQRHEPLAGEPSVSAVPDIKVIGDDGEEGEAEMVDEAHPELDGKDKMGSGEAYAATMDDRRRVFGENVLPSRKTKSLLQLMWLALKDKVLVNAVPISYIPPSLILHSGSTVYSGHCVFGSRFLPGLWDSSSGR